ncbi:MAG TPA: hypothetical protein VGC18_04375 [Lacisediminihabitans sp.]|uniref:hypothetical protein n=1 Tax=Lacisediminihabitans sp. TaxID=2787631 RepID=UPI002ED853A8
MPATNAPASPEWRRFAAGSVERRMLLAMSAECGVELRPRPLVLGKNSRIEAEGIDLDGRIVVQLVANQGAYKPSYRNKVMADLFKLLWLRSSIPSARRAVLVVTQVVAQALGGWVAVAANDLGIDVYVFDGDRVERLPSES